ncbi:glycosyltransferase family 4 protein [Sphingomonas arantia]|uniref:Glycosyltransferase family 4 protein n=1 Tax=Sphingomonas arantia TaxID=1460676 RepID=A0ABW4U4M7_9SPHN
MSDTRFHDNRSGTEQGLLEQPPKRGAQPTGPIADVPTEPPAATIPTIAYFTNVYPKPSHTFIRTEIAALEAQGFAVVRITIRPPADPLVDADDRAEADRTQRLLDRDPRPLIAAVLRQLRRDPRKLLSATATLFAARAAWLTPVRSLACLAEACRLVAIADAHAVRHVHVHFGTNPATVAWLANRIAGLGYSMTVHGPDEYDAPVAWRLREKIAGAAFVAAVSDYGRAQLMRWAAPADWSRLHVVRCGLRGEWWSPRRTIDGPTASTVLVCVARLSAQKGIPLLLDAAAALLARGRKFQLRIVGDGELRAALDDAIAARGLGRVVRLLGWRDAAAVRAEILGARTLVLPSFAEGLPVVLMEALAMERPVIATAIAGIPELVDDDCGWLIPAGSVESLTTAMDAALSASPVTLRAMATCGRARVRRDHDGDVNAGRLATLLRAALVPPQSDTRRRNHP